MIGVSVCLACYSFFFFNDTATTEIYTLSLHDALPIFVTGVLSASRAWALPSVCRVDLAYTETSVQCGAVLGCNGGDRKSTSELQSRSDLVCRLLLEKKNNSYSIDSVHDQNQVTHCATF